MAITYRIDDGSKTSGGKTGANLGNIANTKPSPQPKNRPPSTVIPGQGGAYGGFSPSSKTSAPTTGTKKTTESSPIVPYGSPPIISSAPELPMMSDDDWLATDQGYLNQIAALERALAAFQSDYDRQLADYDTDYKSAWGALGYRDADDDLATWDDGQFAFDDRLTAAGRGYHSLMNDFAGRGLLQSSHFGRAQDDFRESLARQLDSLGTGRQRFQADQGSRLAAFQEQDEAARLAARQAALDRRAMSLMQMF